LLSALDAGDTQVLSGCWADLPRLLDRHHVDACVVTESDVVARCRTLRERGYRAALIAHSGAPSTTEEVLALEAGADDYWTGSDPTALRARIRACVRRCGDVAREGQGVGRIELAKEDALVEGRPCGLTRRELSLLHLLVRRLGEVVTRHEVLEHWGLAAAAQEGNFIDVHVMRLRRKLGAAGGQLETVRGRGLCLHERSVQRASAGAELGSGGA
jgi:DNA-binding response OmpR family regulator